MSNSLGTLNSSLILQEALSLVFTKRPLLSAISKDLSPLGAKQGQTVLTRTKAVPSVVNDTEELPSFNTTDVSVQLSQSKRVGATFTSAQLNSTSRNLVQELAEPIAIAMGNSIVDSVAALWTTGNFANETVSNSPDYSTLVALRKALIDRGVHGNRYLSVNAATYAALLEDPLITRPNRYMAMGQDIIQTSEIAGVAGFENIFEYPATPTTAHMTGFACTPEAVVLASRPPQDPREAFGGNIPFNGNFEIISDPATGFSAAAVEFIDPMTLNVTVYMKWIYGVAVGNPLAGQRLVYQANS
jgi:hypothetical protein